MRLLETDHLAVEGLRQELLPVIKPKRARGADASDLEVTGIIRRDDARGSGRADEGQREAGVSSLSASCSRTWL